MTKIELYSKFLNRFMKDENSEHITILDTNTFKEYDISKVALDNDDQLYIESIDKSPVSMELFESLAKDYLISKLLSIEVHFYSFLEGETLYAISLDDSGKFFIETYKRTLYVEIIDNLVDKH